MTDEINEVKVNDEWKEATTGNVVKLEEGESLQGQYVGIEQSHQYKDSFAFKVSVDGDVKVTFVSNIVKELIETNGIKEGQDVKLTYDGMKESENGS